MDLGKLYELYEKIIIIRTAEEGIVAEYPKKEIRTPVHLYIGQEAIAAGVSSNLQASDFIVSNHRCHGHALAKGLEIEPFFLELYGKSGGTSNGWGGSMHLCDPASGVIGTSAIVAGGIPIGAGIALAQKIKQQTGITVIYFGDGAIDEGVFWETINFSALKKLPILFVLEDNKYASQTPAAMRHSYQDIAPIIAGFGLPVAKVDGTDAVAVADISRELLKDIRQDKGPGFLVCDTYRWMGHVGPTDDTASGYRCPEEVAYWREKCPVQKMKEYLIRRDPKRACTIIEQIDAKWRENVQRAIRQAKEAPYAVD